MPRPEKSKYTLDYSLTLNNLYIALYENSNNPYTKAGAVFGFRGTLTGEALDKLLDQSRSEEEATKQETQPFMSVDDYSRVINLYSRKEFGYKGSQKRFFIAHLGGWRSAKVTLSQKTDIIFNGKNKSDGGVRAEFREDFVSWKCYTDDSGNYVFFRADDYIGKTQNKGTRSISEYIISCNYHLINQYCERKERLKEVICAFTENMEDDERKRSGKKGLNNLYDEHQEEIKRLMACLEKLILTYENSDNTMEKDWSLARALSYLVIGGMLREAMSCKLIEENFEEYLPKSDTTGIGKDMAEEGSIKKAKATLSVPEQFWQAGKTWYEEARKPGARFHSLDIVNHILPSAKDKPAGSEYRFPFKAADTNENTIQCSRFSELLQDKNSIYHQGHFMLIGEGGIGKTTTLMSAMQDAYEGRDIYKGESVIPLFVELSLAPDSQDSHAYDGTSSSVIHRLIYAVLQRKGSKKDYTDLLRDCMNEGSSIARDTIRELLTSVTDDDSRYVLLIDGLNEVSPEPFTGRSSSAQRRIMQEIREIIEVYPNVTIILTGRQGAFIDHPSFHPFYLHGLVWEEIEDYLREKGKTNEEISLIRKSDKSLLNVLSIPMFLTMFVLLRDTEGITTRGELLKVFFHERFERRKSEYTIHRQGDISVRISQDEEQSVSGKMTRGNMTLPMQWMFLDILIPEIAAKMERAHEFRISERDVRSLLESLFKGQDSLYCGNYKEFSNVCFAEQLQGEDLEDVISDFTEAYRQKAARYCSTFLRYCESSMGILYREGEKSFGFVHQHFRDYFAAVCNANRMKIAYTAYQEGDTGSARALMQQYDKEPLNPVLMVYIGEYLGEHHNTSRNPETSKISYETDVTEEILRTRQLINSLYDIYRGIDQENFFGVYNLIEISKRVRTDLSGSDFHGLDLRHCRFYNVPLDSITGTRLTGAVINADNWFVEGHSGQVNNAAFNGDGSLVVTASVDNTARIWDSRTGKLLHTLEGHSGQVNNAAFNGDGSLVVTASGDNTARIWDSHTGKLLHTLEGHSEWVNSAAFSEDGSLVVTASWDNTARIWDSRTGKLLHALEGHSECVNSAAFNGDGSLVVTASGDSTARIWDSRTGELLHTLEGHSSGVTSAAFSGDGSLVVTASGDSTARIWDSRTGELLHTLEGHFGEVTSAVFSGDGSLVVTTSGDSTARIWDSRTGELLHTLGHSREVNSAAFNGDGSLVVTASSDSTVRIWDSRTGELLHILEGNFGVVNSAAFSRDGRLLVTASNDSTARIWDSRTGELLHALEGQEGLFKWVESAAFSGDGSLVVTASSDNTARIWDSRTGELLHILEGHFGEVNSAAFNGDGSLVITAAWDNTARIWDSHTGKLLHALDHSRKVTSAAFNGNGSLIVTASSDNTARIWDSRTGGQLLTLEGHSGEVNSAVFSGDGSLVVTASSDSTARIWDSRTGGQLHTLEGHSGEVNSAVFSGDGSLVVTASSDSTARIWDSRTGELLHILEGNIREENSAAFNGDGSQVVTASWDNTAQIWDSHTGKLLHTLEGHSGEVTSAAYSGDGSLVVTTSWDNTVRIWDSHTGKLLHTLEGHSREVNSAAFNGDGSLVVTASGDNTVRIWDVETGKQLRVLYEVSGLHIKGVKFNDISPHSKLTTKQKEIFRQYGALI